jgi:HK97 gp10 family phage protein
MKEQVLSYRVDGLAQLEANLRAMGTEVAVKWTNGALRAGVRVFQLAAQGNVPVREGVLKKTIRIRRGKKERADNVREYFLIAGSRQKGGGGAFYAHMVEGGTKPHTIKGRMREGDKPGRLLYGGNYARVVNHPGTKGTHFMERAARNGTGAAVGAYAGYIRTKLAKSGMLNPATETE